MRSADFTVGEKYVIQTPDGERVAYFKHPTILKGFVFGTGISSLEVVFCQNGRNVRPATPEEVAAWKAGLIEEYARKIEAL